MLQRFLTNSENFPIMPHSGHSLAAILAKRLNNSDLRSLFQTEALQATLIRVNVARNKDGQG